MLTTGLIKPFISIVSESWGSREDALHECRRSRNDQGPEVFLKVVHITPPDNDGSGDRTQTVEIALGPKAAFSRKNPASLSRNCGSLVSAVPLPKGKPRPPREPRTPHVAELLRKAIKWQGLLESGQVPSRAAIARREGLTRARVTQIFSLLNLGPGIQEYILSMPDTVGMPAVTERSLRPIARIKDPGRQAEEFEKLVQTYRP